MKDRLFVIQWRLWQAEQRLKGLWKDEEGIGTIELVLILVVLIALVAMFKDKLLKVAEDILNKISQNANNI